MKSGELSAFLSDTFQIKPGTVSDHMAALRRVGLLSKGDRGRYGGVDLTDTDCINAMLAITIDHRYGEDIADNVKRIRKLPREDEARFGPFTVPMTGEPSISTTEAKTFGAALDGLLADIRGGAFELLENTFPKNPFDVTLTIDSEHDECALTLMRKGDVLQGAWTGFFRKHGLTTHAVVRQMHITRDVFEILAAKLGPPG